MIVSLYAGGMTSGNVDERAPSGVVIEDLVVDLKQVGEGALGDVLTTQS